MGGVPLSCLEDFKIGELYLGHSSPLSVLSRLWGVGQGGKARRWGWKGAMNF